MSKSKEIEVLNFEDLDVEELEQRLEMAMGSNIVVPDDWVCIGHVECPNLCAGVCPTLCSSDCPTLCADYTCDTYGCGGGHQIP